MSVVIVVKFFRLFLEVAGVPEDRMVQESIKRREIGCASPGAIDDQALLFHRQAVSDDGLRTARSQDFGDCG